MDVDKLNYSPGAQMSLSSLDPVAAARLADTNKIMTCPFSDGVLLRFEP